ncbi:hypothetical protein O6H91_Y333800 [Diphasiastrum complanatum]|nr:hypothetical protein O6H91_Y333800 [Diphasiastrum complanatum]
MPSWTTWLSHWIQRPSRCQVSGRPIISCQHAYTESQPEQPHEVPIVPPAPQRVYVRRTALLVPPMPFRPAAPPSPSTSAAPSLHGRSPSVPRFSLAAPTSTVAPPVAAPTLHPHP